LLNTGRAATTVVEVTVDVDVVAIGDLPGSGWGPREAGPAKALAKKLQLTVKPARMVTQGNDRSLTIAPDRRVGTCC
jgi:hypothetical protein